jgi:glycosyltransferase involved in cell wall biosynthesis
MPKKKKILIISYHYPPDLAIGAIRPSKFVEYLPEYGFEPIVLTVKEKYYEYLDTDEIEPMLKKSDIFRTLRIPNFRDIYLSVKTIVIKNTLDGKKNFSLVRNSYGDVINEFPESTVERLKRYFNSLVVWLPDDKTGWIIPAVLKGLRLIHNRKIDAIYTTGPPHSVHIIGLLLKLLTKRTWFADFRDPWMVSQKPTFVRSKLSDLIENWLVYKVVSKSDKVISVTPEMTESFQNCFSNIKSEKFVTIYNGYDSEQLKEYTKLKKNTKITFTYAGSFYYGRDPELFLRALRHLIDEKKIAEDTVAVKFIGNCRYLYEKSIEELVEQIGLTKIVSFIDTIPRHEAFKEMAKSHLLLLYAPDQSLQIPGKLYEYIGLRATILAVCGPGATANILADYEHAVIVANDSVKDMKDALLKTIQHVKNIGSSGSEGLQSTYGAQLERKELTRELAEHFDALL